VLVDAMTAEIEGFMLAEKLKADSGLDVKALLLLNPPECPGAQDRISREVFIVRGGMTVDCLYKPVDRSALELAIRKAVGSKSKVDLEAGAPVPVAEQPCIPPLNILMAEDNPFNHRVARLMLAKLNHSLTIVVNGREAVAALERHPYDLVLMDIQMPDMDGFQATAAIRSAEAGTDRHVPIIALTAHAMKDDMERCLRAGMDAYVTKPIRAEKLRKAIEGCFAQVPRTTAAESPIEPAEAIWDEAGALARLEGDRALLRHMASLLLPELPKLMERIRAAVAEEDAKSLSAPVHTLKNWSANFGAVATLAALEPLEACCRAERGVPVERAMRTLEGAVAGLTHCLASLVGQAASTYETINSHRG
jgi:CheY-like chemotaxis protein